MISEHLTPRAAAMKAWSLRTKSTFLVVGLTTGSILLASTIHHRFALRALREDVRTRAAYVASELAFGITTRAELEDSGLLAAQIRNTLAARPTLRWIEVYAAGPGGLSRVASSVAAGGRAVPDLAAKAFAAGRTMTAMADANEGEGWLAAAPIALADGRAGTVLLALSVEGANRLAVSLQEQLLITLLVAGVATIVALTLFIERGLNRPIRLLLASMAAVERGDLTATPPLTRRDEMGELAVGFARMLRRIRESQAENAHLLDEIHRFNLELQRRVDEATEVLAERNEALQKANELLFDLTRQLRRAEHFATMGQLTATMAHEIGTPLNAVSLHLQLLGRSIGLTAADRHRLSIIDQQIQRLVKTIQDFLAAARVEPPPRQVIRLNALIRNVTHLMLPALTAKGIAHDLRLAEPLAPIRADEHQMQQLLLNLVSNAVDAMPGGGRLRIETASGDGFVTLTVADSGPGIPPALRARVFKPFFTTKGAAGTGLGLAVCRSIVEVHHGTIELDSHSGAGATFVVRIPTPSEEVHG
jgi:signal transduction histidine kinase